MRCSAPAAWILGGLFLAGFVRADSPTSDRTRAVDLGGLEARSAALVLSGEEGGELDVSVLPIPLRRGPESVRVVLVIDIEDDERKVAEGADGLPVTEVYVYALDGELRIAGFLAQGFVLGPEEQRGVKFFGQLDLPPGDYSLRVLVLRRSEERMGLRVVPLSVPPWEEGQTPQFETESPEHWVLVFPAPADESDLSDFTVRVDGEPMVPATRARRPLAAERESAVPKESGKLRHRELVSRYAEALRLLASSELEAARTTLIALEQSAFDRGAQDALAPDLLELAAQLADVESESLVPLLELHEGAYREHHRAERYLFATHSRRMLTGLGEIYLRVNDSGESRSLVAAAFASLGGYLQELGSTLGAEAAYKEALGYHPGQEAALLGWASIQETYGRHQEAAETLKRLLDKHPGNAEARLRRAVCLDRLGATREALSLYRESLGAGEDWIRAVAYQELAELYTTEKRYGEAAALLGEAVDRLPRYQRLYLQLAAVYDHMERPVEAREVLDRLDPRAGRESDSPRMIYSRFANRAIEATRRHLAEAAHSRLEKLAAALSSTGALEE